jgi:Skp family chaperone for outer membrane proteins
MMAWKSAGLVAALVAVGLTGAATQGHAQKKDKEKADSTVGFVDLARVMDQIKKTTTWTRETKRFDDERVKFQGEIAALTKVRYLTVPERETLTQLRAKPTATASEKARIAELEAKSDALDKEAQTLAAVEKPTEEQGKRIEELAKLRQAAIANLQDETEQRSQALQALEGKVLDEMQDKILEHVQGVAKNKGLTFVLDQRAVLYGGQDLTDDVLLKLGVPKK